MRFPNIGALFEKILEEKKNATDSRVRIPPGVHWNRQYT